MSQQHFPTIEQLSGDPHPHLAELRAQSPVAWVPELSSWLVTGRGAAVDVMRDDARFTVDDPRFSTGRVVGPSMLSLDGAEHTRHRAAFAAAFRPALTRERMASRVEETAGRLVHTMVDVEPVDLRTALAATLAAEVVIDVLGLVETTPADILGWYTSIAAKVSALTIDLDAVAEDPLMAGVRASVARTVEHRHSSLATIRENADLSDAEFTSNVAIVLFGALETSEAMITNLLWYVIRDPELWHRLQAMPSRRERAVDESLRLEPGAAIVDRYAVAATEVAGVEIEAGDPLRVSLTAANRDPNFYEDPDRFSLDRDSEPPHLTFATGPHTCIGAPLARMEALAALDAMLDSPARPTVADTGFESPTGLVFRKPERLMVNWNDGPPS